MSDSPKKIRPFSNASEFESWLGNNCFKCSKYNPDGYPTCEIDEAILLASAGEDTISYAIALRMGADTDLSYGWQWRQLCTEFKPVLNYYAIAVLGESPHEERQHKQVLLGPFETEALAIASIPVAKDLLQQLYQTGRLKHAKTQRLVNPETFNFAVEQLNGRGLGSLEILREMLERGHHLTPLSAESSTAPTFSTATPVKRLRSRTKSSQSRSNYQQLELF